MRSIAETSRFACGMWAFWLNAGMALAQVAPVPEREIPLLITGHPRLYFSAEELPQLREKRQTHASAARIWRNVEESARWCCQQKPREDWIATQADDPQYENLYDRFYAAMHDLAIVEHLSLASALSNPEDDPYFSAARDWAVAAARVWQHEADNPPDASKAYAVLRVMKGLAVAYDALYPRLTDEERAVVREALVRVCSAYYQFFHDPQVAGEGYNKHHGSVDAPPLGIVALALLGEVPDAEAWLKLVLKKHEDYLLLQALTPSGTNDQSSNFWASTMHYRIFFGDALRRVTGRNLFAEFPDSLPGRIGLAAVAQGQPADLLHNQDNRSVLFGPCYGQIDYWSPVFVYLAREQRRPIFQYLANWDESAGHLQRTRYITPRRKEELLFTFGPYVYIWHDPSVPCEVEPNLPLVFEFPEPEVNEAYLRNSYRPGDLVVAFKKGGLVVHAGGSPVLVDLLQTADPNAPAKPVSEMLVADDGRQAWIRCVGPEGAGMTEQRITLHRPNRLTVHRKTQHTLKWWFAGNPTQDSQGWNWPSGVRLRIDQGRFVGVDAAGYVDAKVHYGGMKFADPSPFTYPALEVEPVDGTIAITIESPVVP